MKLSGWEKVTSAEQYRQMIEVEYYRLKEERSSAVSAGGGFEEIKLRLFLSLLEKPQRAHSVSDEIHNEEKGVVCEFPARPGTKVPAELLHDNQATAD
jgi:hypothetical protein